MVARRLLTVSDVRSLLEAHGLAPHRARGQSFMVDPNTVRRLVRDAGLVPGALVCEVGPGLGSLTLGLREAGARVVAVEVDAGLVRALADVVGGDPDVRVVHADATAVDYRALLGGPAALVANLPYRTATPILLHCLEAGVFTGVSVVVQREAAQRWAAQPGDPLHGAVSVRVGAMAAVRLGAPVSRRAFYPVPHVDSVSVHLEPRPWTAATPREQVLALVERGFAQRRKLLRNSLAGGTVAPEQVERALAEAGLPPGARAEQLGLEGWIAVAERLAPGG